MYRLNLRAAFAAARRILPLGLAAFLVISAFGASVPARAQTTQDDPTPPAPVVRDHRDGQTPRRREPRTTVDPNAPPPIVRDHRTGSAPVEQAPADDPAARIQIILRTIHVANDRDGAFRGAGDFTLTASFFRCKGPQPPCSSGDGEAALVAQWKRDFGADSGDSKTLDRIMPVTADIKEVSLASEDGGLVLHDGRSYMFQVTMFERDGIAGGDFMGGIQRIIDKSNYWGVGTYEREAAGELKEKNFGTDDMCAGCGGIIVGDYLVTYEIVAASLPDLRPTAIRLLGDAGDGLEEVCVAVQNQGPETAGPFNMSLYVDQAPALNGSVNLVGLGAGSPHEGCFRTSLPTTGLHSLDLIVDQGRAVPEMNERNNQLQQPLDRGPAAPTPSPEPTPTTVPSDGASSNPTPTPGPILIQAPSQGQEQGQAKADLTVTAIRVRGQVPDGKEDCKDGGNDVAVVVKNTGSANAGPFTVRLKVDAQGDGAEQTVNSLEAGKEREIKFDGVRLKKGEHKLTATVDAKATVAEASDENNERTVTTSCKDDN